MAINPQYMIAPSLQEYFVDKDTGLPLAAGIVTFYSDNNRTDLKPVYQLTGSPPDYTYTALPNPCILSSVGTFQDADGNDILPYYFPYDADGNVELYFITVYSSIDGEPAVEQFTREAWPNVGGAGSTAENILNYVPNGQFLAHTNIPATATTDAGEVTTPTTIIAQGGWTFDRPDTSTATDIVTFFRYGAAIDNPTGNPRFAFHLQTTTASPGDTFKDLRLEFRDVNKFASVDQEYTYAFTAQSDSGSSVTANVILIKNFGTGGSTTTERNIGSITIPTSSTIINVPFVFGTNDSKTIGDLDDDYLQIAIRFPINVVLDVLITDVILTSGNVIVTQFPATTDADFLTRSLAGWIPVPNPDGSDIGLPIILGRQGFEFDDSSVGNIEMSITDTTPGFGRLLCSSTLNTDIYLTNDYSADGIPYARLQDKLWVPSSNAPRFGTGQNFFLASPLTVTGLNAILISNNNFGTATNAADGAIPTGFTFANVTSGMATATYQSYYYSVSNGVISVAKVIGETIAATNGTSGFSFNSIRYAESVTPSVFALTTLAATGLAGLYFTFATTTTNYYVWFKVNGSGADPAPGGTGIQCNLGTNYTDVQVAACVLGAISGYHQDAVTCVAASGITPGSYFNIYAQNGDQYYIWYTKAGAGSNPNVSGKTGIQVALAGTETAIQVATATQIAINSYSFATPPIATTFLRGRSASTGWDYESVNRFGCIPGVIGTALGTYELDDLIEHTHVQLAHKHAAATGQFLETGAGGGTLSAGATNYAASSFTGDTVAVNDYTGGAETQPINTYVTYFIRY